MSRWCVPAALFLAALVVTPALAQPPRGSGRVSGGMSGGAAPKSPVPEPTPVAGAQPDVLHLTNGSAVKGYVESETDERVVLVREMRRGSFTRATFGRDRVARIAYAPDEARAAMAERIAWWESKGSRDALAASGFPVTKSQEHPGSWEAAGPAYRIISDVDAATARELAFRLNTMYARWLALFRRSAAGGPPTRMFVVRSAAAYRGLLQRMGAPPHVAAMSGGIYLPPPVDVSLIPIQHNDERGVRAYISQSDARRGGVYDPGWDRYKRGVKSNLATQRALQISTAYHEGMHAFMAKELFAGRESVPVWLHEGMAAYVEMVREDMQGLRTQAVNPFRYPTAEAGARSGTLPDIRVLVQRQASITGHDTHASAGMFYAAAWALVYYLNVERDGLENDMYARYVADLEQGTDAVAAFEAMTGEPIDQTGAAWRRSIPHWK